MTVFCDNYGCIFIDECGFCDCDNLNIVGGVCDGSYHNDRNATEQAIAATLGGGMLTAEYVCEAIFNNSSYASYDGVKYYADGIGMQAVADELNTHIEQTCNLIEDGDLLHCSNCGGAAEKQLWAYWNYCPNCRAKVIK